MAKTNTTTATESLTRILSLHNQFRIAFMNIMEYSAEECTPFLNAIDDHAIHSIRFWAYSYNDDGTKEKWGEITLRVDWDKHNFLMSTENQTVVLKKKWGGGLPETRAAVESLNELIRTYKLKVNFSVGFVDNISTDRYNYYMKYLGLVKGTPIKWKYPNIHKESYDSIVLEEFGIDLEWSEE